MIIMALGFALSFSVGGAWHTMHGSEPALDWWKYWEMSIGLGGGLSMGLVFCLFNRPETDMPRPVTRGERIWGAGFPVWLVSSLIMMNAYKGFVNIHDLNWLVAARVAVSTLILIITTALFIRFLRATYLKPDALPLPLWVCGAVQIIIIVSGYLVSVHVPVRLWNSTLLLMYICYIGVSLLIFLLMLCCREKRKVLLAQSIGRRGITC